MKSMKKIKEREKKIKAKLLKRREWMRQKEKEERKLDLLRQKTMPKQTPFVKSNAEIPEVKLESEQ